ncbi:hypothetical protein EUGRSUZ_K03199 [Eucalyptus grandis]|uniref:Uncharacterized protein n=2 Tax=Eucalyptus grandis TaxID=71139 RepID=A0ACC3J0C1_EUCGR|nr:hypothetical protein EUGRSUZ_K03199 [Eucalyptus grandis]
MTNLLVAPPPLDLADDGCPTRVTLCRQCIGKSQTITWHQEEADRLTSKVKFGAHSTCPGYEGTREISCISEDRSKKCKFEEVHSYRNPIRYCVGKSGIIDFDFEFCLSYVPFLYYSSLDFESSTHNLK